MVQIPQHVLEWLATLERQAYQKGWDDATIAVVEAAKARRPSGPGPVAATPTPRPAVVMANREGRSSNREAVIRALSASPGLRPTDVPRWLEQAGTPMNPQSIYTLIKRMRREGNIEKRGNGYYLVGSLKEAAE